ncbi:MAG: aldehyde dehydrogenase family protein [Verrucomicrobia bacterium]|nr:aldehyde dehydrogenase family protein [Verrucomicrobiota bacterium]
MPTVKEIFATMEYGPAPESPDFVNAWLEKHGRRFGHFINGRFVEGSNRFEVINPANKAVIATVSQGSSAEIDQAVQAAGAAFEHWRALSGHERARYLYAIARQVQKHSRLFAVLETMDNGKPIRETRDIDIPLVARHFYHHAGWAQLASEVFEHYGPLGVCGQIIPWNFPLLMLSWKVAPALAAGNTVVLKPAEFTPLSALLFAEITQQIGLPAGVFNLVTGDGRTGEALVEHPVIAKIAFTGSTEVGRIIRQKTAGSGKKLSLELGGKSPFVVFEDADLDSVVEGVVDAIWFNQGQVCCAGSRLLIQESIAEAMYAKLRNRMENLRVGNPLDKAIDIGAIVAPVQLQKIESLVQQGIREGASCWQPGWAVPTEGLFYPPTLFTNVEPAGTLAQVEIFGPVLVAMTFRTPTEAVELANNTPYGLAASIWTENVNLALDIAPKIKAGVVWVNCTNVFDAASGFGGYRESGFGREGGAEGMYEYLRPNWEQNLPEVELSEFVPRAEPGISAGLPDEASRSLNDGAKSEKTGNGDLSDVASRVSDSDEQELVPTGLSVRIDRTPKLYIGGKQARPDSGYSYPVFDPTGKHRGEAGLGNRKDIRNAVEAAAKGSGWARSAAHLRAQILFYIAENLQVRAQEFAKRLVEDCGYSEESAEREVTAAIERTFYYASWADKYDGRIHQTPFRNVTLAMPEPWGILGIVCPETSPLLGFLSLVLPAVAMGNAVVAVPSASYPLAATDLYQIFDTSDLPAGVINIVTGNQLELAKVLAQHLEIAALWFFGSKSGSKMVERESAGNLKATWVIQGKARDWFTAEQAQGEEFLRHATQIKNIWVPYGE